MRVRDLSQLSDRLLLDALHSLVARDRATTAELIAHLAEVDARRLYLPAAYPSMLAYCIGELRLSEDSALKRIRAARAAREFPVLFDAIASGRLTLTAVLTLAPHLTAANVDDLAGSAAHLAKTELEALLAERFPRADLPTRIEIVPGSATLELAPERVETGTTELAPERVDAPIGPPAKLTRLAPERVALQVTIASTTHDKLRYAQSLLGHAVPSGDVAETLDRALDALIANLEKRRFGGASRTRPRSARASSDPRHIPASVRRQVWERDGGQCTFTSESGQRCPSCTRIELDHVQPVARGGESSVANLRLRCRAHNQYEAERTFGAGFMAEKRQQAPVRRRAPKSEPLAPEQTEVIPYLRELGFRKAEARAGAEACASRIADPLEVRVRHAISILAPPHARRVAPAAAAG